MCLQIAKGKTLVIGLGNPIVSDDGVGLRVVQRLKTILADRDDVDVREDYRGGLQLMERMIGYERAIVVDAIRWLLLKRSANLDASKREPERLGEALKLNEPLAIAYHLKDQLNEIWEQDDQETAQALLMDWIVYAESTGIRILKQFAKTLRFHAWGILAWYDHPISTGPLEGTNNKIKTMKRQAYGFRDPEFLMLKILGIHQTTYALVG